MLHPATPILLFALAAPVVAGADVRGPAGVAVTQVSIHERIIIRVPRVTSAAQSADRTALPPPVRWKEKKGPKCIGAADLAGAMVTASDIVDLMMTDGRRVRAKLDGACRPLDYYPGFYLKPGADGQVCAARDGILVRSGASCPIASFKTLRAKR